MMLCAFGRERMGAVRRDERIMRIFRVYSVMERHSEVQRMASQLIPIFIVPGIMSEVTNLRRCSCVR